MQLLGSSLLALAVLLASSPHDTCAVRKGVISEALSEGEAAAEKAAAAEEAEKEAAEKAAAEKAAAAGEAEKEVAEKANKPKCKNWCKKQAIALGTMPSMEKFKELANAKCTQEDCKGCTGNGATVPDCQKEAEIVMEAIEVPDVQVVKIQAEMGDEVQPCTPGGVFTTKKPCSFGQEICSHVDAAWCEQPARNAGHQFRSQGKGKPLCCFDEEASNMDGVEKQVAEVLESMSGKQKEEEEEDKEEEDAEDYVHSEEEKEVPALPQCAVDETFGVDSFTIRGEPVNRCRSSTGRFAPKVCCNPAAFKLAESHQRAKEVCKTMAWSACKPDGLTGRKEWEAKGLTVATHGCKKMYMCVGQGQEGEEGYGPVGSLRGCQADKTLLGKNLPARKACFAYRL